MSRILLLTFGELTRDPRARRQAEAAVARGHTVVGVCPSIPDADTVPLSGVEVVRIAPGRVTTRLRNAGYGGIERRDRAVARELRGLYRLVRLVRVNRALALAAQRLGPFDVVHANEFETLLAGWLVRRLTGGRLIYDAHEYFADCYPDPPRAYHRVTVALERLLAPRADEVITVGDGIAALMQRSLPLATRPHVVMNCPTRTQTVPERRPEGTPLRAVYQASAGASRPISDLLDALEASKHARLTIRLANTDLDRLRSAVRARALHDRVEVAAPVLPVDLVRALLGYDVGVVISRPLTVNDRLALPNKLFEYMAAGLALAVPRLEAMGSLVESERIGVTYDPADPRTLGRALDSLAVDGARLADMRSRAATLAASHFNAEHEAARLAHVWAGAADT